ncbi:MAG: hypothetical protein GX959_04905 [Clostridiales bacterium]|nr:hypothetical protein [Clostridiales bacterium]
MDKFLDYLDSISGLLVAIAIALVVVLVVIAIVSIVMSKRKIRKKKAETQENEAEIRNILAGKSEPISYEYELEDDVFEREAGSELEWVEGQAMFVLPDELTEKTDAQNGETSPYNDRYERVKQLEYYEVEEALAQNRMTKKETTMPDEQITSIIMTPILAKPKKPRPSKEKPPVERVKSSFDDDFIYDVNLASFPGSIILYKDFKNKYRLRFRASNGKTLAHSQAFDRKLEASTAAANIIDIGRLANYTDTTKFDYIPVVGIPTYEVFLDSDFRYRYKLVSSNGRVLLASQSFINKWNCINAVQGLKDVLDLYEYFDQTRKKEYVETELFQEYLDSLKHVEETMEEKPQ